MEKTKVPIKSIKVNMPETMEYYVNLHSDREKTKFIKRTERVVRSSLEYKDYINYLKENVGLNHCTFFKNISTDRSKRRGKISIEMHHEPFTLFDYVQVILNKYIDEGKEVRDLMIADEVMELHYANKVGLVPLSKTAHQIVHNSSKLLVPLNMVYGNYNEFVSEYYDYIPTDVLEKLQRKIDMTKNLTEKDFENIKKEFTYLDMDKVNDLEKIPVREEKEIFG